MKIKIILSVLMVILIAVIWLPKGVWQALDPMVYMRIWTVSGTNFYRGHGDSFWLKSSAMEYFETIKDRYAIIDLKNEITGKRERLVDRWDEIFGDMVVVVDEKQQVIRHDNVKSEFVKGYIQAGEIK